MNIIILIIIIIIIFIKIITNCRKTYNKYNINKHLTNEYHYAHFSTIYKYNKLIYPELILTSPIFIRLNEGESLYIPKLWWHWVTSDSFTVSINYWCKNFKYYNKYMKINTSFQNNKLLLDKILLYDKDIINIDTNNNIYIDKINNNNQKFIITLHGYKNNNNKNKDNNNSYNLDFFNNIKKYIKIPYIFKNYDVDTNIWIANGNHDTGLHYDDYSGMISVIKGYKNIILFPPSDSFYLNPYCVIPFWAKSKPLDFFYNTYEYIKELSDKTSLPSSRLLYEIINNYNNKKMLQYITNVINNIGSNKIVYGCKLHNNIFRCELYFYHFNDKDNNIKSDQKLINYNFTYNKLPDQDNIIIHSIDLYNYENKMTTDDINIYYKINNLVLPTRGYNNIFNSKTLKINLEPNELYILDITEIFIKNFEKYLDIIKLKDFYNHKYLLYKYKSVYTCIWNKNNNIIYIQYLGISIYDFINFLIEFNYPNDFINHVKKNIELYKNIKHEISIIYDINYKVIRTAFFGLV